MKSVRQLVELGYDFEDIRDYYYDRGLDDEEIDELIVDTGYDWQEALRDAIRDKQIDLYDADYYADLLGVNESDIYDLFYEDESPIAE